MLRTFAASLRLNSKLAILLGSSLRFAFQHQVLTRQQFIRLRCSKRKRGMALIVTPGTYRTPRKRSKRPEIPANRYKIS